MTRIKYDTQEKSHMHFFPHFIFMLFYPFAQAIISYVRLHRDNIPHTLHFTEYIFNLRELDLISIASKVNHNHNTLNSA